MTEMPSEELYKLTRLAGGDARRLKDFIECWRQGVVYGRWEASGAMAQAIHALPSAYAEDHEPIILDGQRGTEVGGMKHDPNLVDAVAQQILKSATENWAGWDSMEYPEAKDDK